MIEVEHLSKVYSGRKAVDDVSFNVGKGEVLGFLGPNGAGKTTTMRILTCYMPSTEGTARIAGFDVFEQSLEVRKRIGYLPETPPIYPEMSVESYLGFVARIKDTPSNRRTQQVGKVIEECSLGDVRHRIIGRLSKGYKQRVGLAQALLNDPEVLILDEPTIGLDPRQIHEVRSLIKGLAPARTVILSTHILPEVSMTCNRVVIINKGKVVAMDTPEGLAAQMKGAERIALTVAGPAEAVRAKILAIEDVFSVAVADGGPAAAPSFTVECRLHSDLRPVLARAMVAEGWDLLEMRGVSLSLEDVFINLTTQEPGEAESAAAGSRPAAEDQPGNGQEV